MKQYTAKEVKALAFAHGRTWLQEEGPLWFNWTCSGFTFRFKGSVLRVTIRSVENQMPAFPGFPENPIEYPCIGAVGEDGESLICRYECREKEASYELFSGDPGEHLLRLVKLSEGSRGQAGLVSLWTDGELLPADLQEKPVKIEFVGDSITCGYGNECPNMNEHFNPNEENGWMTYGAIAARAVGAEFNMISYSGISTALPEHSRFPFHMPSMEELYAYTDRDVQEKFGLEPEAWDFAANKKDIVLLNLGTNDVNPIRFAPDRQTAAREEAHFVKKYGEFLKKVRALNGPDTLILSVLGPMDYYLYDRIREAVDAYQKETGDEKIRTFKFIGINLMSEGFGADGHPSMKTHVRIGAQLGEILKEILA